MYKLIVLDIDGTTIKNDRSISNNTKNTINKAVDAGVNVCLCTGRNVHNTYKVAEELGLKTPFVAIDGAVVYDPITKKMLHQKFIPNHVIKEMVNEILKENLYIEFCTFNKYIKYIPNKGLAKFSYGGVPENICNRLEEFFNRNIRYIKNVDKILNSDLIINLFLFAGEKHNVDKVKNILLKQNLDLVIRDDLWDEYVFVVAKDANKAGGVKLLCQHFGCKMEEVLAIGDQMNDIDMIKEAGMGVAMGNAHEKIKSIANYITLSNEEDGVAAAINKFIF